MGFGFPVVIFENRRIWMVGDGCVSPWWEEEEEEGNGGWLLWLDEGR
jgi:hypothetical protein